MEEKKFKYCGLDLDSASKEELEKEIIRLKDLHNYYVNEEQAVKIYLNSIYGACGSPWFAFYNVSVAEAVTLQGQDLIKYSEKIINRYFLEFWHKDIRVHELMGISDVKRVEKPVVLYIDTDSVAGDTTITTDRGDLTIEELYDICSTENKQSRTRSGKDFVTTNIKTLNEKSGELIYSNIKRLIRHSVSKSKWRLNTISGREIFVTNDHSLIVVRGGKKMEIKPIDVIDGDEVICVDKSLRSMEKIDTCEKVGEFNDEYVYDIEVDDEESHTFFGNGILVHNSNFIRFEEILSKCDWNGTPKEFILKLYRVFLADYLSKCYDIYAKNCGTVNYQKFELEKISDSGIWLAKKKYVYNTIWKDPGIDVEPYTDITAKGVEIVQSSSSKFVRDTLKNLLKYIFIKKKEFNAAEFANLLKNYKEEFKLKSLEDIAHSSSVGDYEKHVLQDKEKIVLEKGCPIHVRASAIYNNMLYNSKYKRKYQPIRSGEKVKYYHVKTKEDDKNVFGFISGSFPVEFALQIDYDIQFNKSIIQPINRFVEAIGHSSLSPNLVTAAQLF